MNVPDLNFLYVLQALYEEKSVSRAADRLGLTQPAVSHALGKLRTLFHDELFVRAGLVMAPTEIGERVAHGAIQALSQIQHDIWDARTFNPLNSTSRCKADRRHQCAEFAHRPEPGRRDRSCRVRAR